MINRSFVNKLRVKNQNRAGNVGTLAGTCSMRELRDLTRLSPKQIAAAIHTAIAYGANALIYNSTNDAITRLLCDKFGFRVVFAYRGQQRTVKVLLGSTREERTEIDDAYAELQTLRDEVRKIKKTTTKIKAGVEARSRSKGSEPDKLSYFGSKPKAAKKAPARRRKLAA